MKSATHVYANNNHAIHVKDFNGESEAPKGSYSQK